MDLPPTCRPYSALEQTCKHSKQEEIMYGDVATCMVDHDSMFQHS